MVKKLSLIAFIVVLALRMQAQDWKLKLSSNVELRTWKLTSTYEKEERSLQGAKIVLTKSGSVIEETTTDGNGDFSIMVPPNGDFILTVSFAGCNTKRFSVNTTGVPENYNSDKSWKPTFSIGGFVMCRAYPGVDYSALEQPLLKVEWKGKKKVFDNDELVTGGGIATVTKIYESEMALIQKFCGLNKQGDVALAKPDCPLAKTLYQQAMAMITFETYPVTQLQKVGDCLKNANDATAKAAEEAAKKAAAEKAAAEKAAADKLAADKAAAEKAATDKAAREAAAKNKAEADAKAKADADAAAKAKADAKAEEERKKKEGLAASKAEDEAAEKAAQEKKKQKEQERLAAEAKAAEDAKVAAANAAKEKAELERKKKEGLAASKAEDEAAEKAALEKKKQKEKERAEAEAKAKAEDTEEAKKIAAEKEAKRKAKEEEDEQKRKQAEAEAANDPSVKGNAKYGLYGVLGEDKYKNTIKKADDYFKMKRWSEAKTVYEEALTYKKDDAYAKSKLDIVNKNLAPK
jgi:hypothetical protein